MSDQLVVIPNVPAGQKPPAPPLKTDNTLFGYRMHYNGFSQIAFSDDYVHLCEALLPGYLAKSQDERLENQIRALLDVQVHLRSQILVSTVQKKKDLQDWELEVLSSEDRAPSGWGGNDEESVDFWSSSVPLTLLEADYAPYTLVPRPISALADVRNPPNIIWLRCGDEKDFLSSLQRAGVLTISSVRHRA